MPLANMEEIYQAHARTVYKFLLSQCHDADLAEELTQETFYQAVRSIDRFNGSCKVSVWLCQIAKHTYFDHCRREKRKGREEEVGAAWPQDSLEERLLDQESLQEIYQGIHALEEPYKEVFLLRLFGELSFAQIAALFHKTESWARVTYYRAKGKIKEGLP